MSKNLRLVIPAILVLLALIGFWWQRQKVAPMLRLDGGLVVVAADGGMAMTADAGVAEAADAGVSAVSDASVALEAPDGGAVASAGDGGSTSSTPSCGNCRLDPITGALTIQLQERFTEEPVFNWTVTGVEISYYGVPAPVIRNVTSGFPPVTAVDASCSKTRAFTVQTASATNIRAINLRMVGPGGVAFKRNCVKLQTGGGSVVLENNCKCCDCALCTDTGTCPL